MLYYFAGFNGYLLLGHYLRNHNWTGRQLCGIGIPMFAIGYAVTFLGFRRMTSLPDFTDEMLELFFTYCSLNVVMMTIPVFMLCKRANFRSERIKKALANLTLCGFGVYMIHYFFTGPSVVLMRAIHVPIYLQIPCAQSSLSVLPGFWWQWHTVVSGSGPSGCWGSLDERLFIFKGGDLGLIISSRFSTYSKRSA